MTQSKTNQSEVAKFKECIETMFKAASVLIFDVLMSPKKWTPLKSDEESAAKHNKQQLDQQQINFEHQKYQTLLSQFSKTYVSSLKNFFI